MGEIAEMMLDGTLCEGCGVYMPGEAQGIPRRCRDCRREAPADPNVSRPKQTKALCCVCGRSVSRVGMADHIKALHSA